MICAAATRGSGAREWIKPMRKAFTLFELCIVMAIIVIAAAILVPMTMTMIADARVDAAADQVRARTADARSHAMEEGRPWRLGFLANTGHFQLAHEDAPCWDNPDTEKSTEIDVIRGELPKDIVFALEQSDISSNKEPAPAGGKWETIALYLPDGTARDDATTYFGKPGAMPMRIRLRALTGAISVESPVIVKESIP